MSKSLDEAACEYSHKQVDEARMCCPTCENHALEFFDLPGKYGPRTFKAGAAWADKHISEKLLALVEALEVIAFDIPESINTTEIEQLQTKAAQNALVAWRSED